jgi:hypothetical protein
MDFIDQIQFIAQQILKLKDQIQTEQATKTAFIMPFMQALGYNVFNPTEVCPEFCADVPGLKGEKVDYAILIDGKPVILFECKSCHEALNHPKHSSQLHRYFHVTEAKFGILTNGVVYRFYTDINKDNVMDEKPFFEFNMLSFDETSIEELKRFSKAGFDPNSLGEVAKNLLYTREIKRILTEQFANPSSDFVRFFARQIHPGNVSASVVERFTDLTRQSFQAFVNETIAERLRKASVIDVIEPEPVEESSDDTESPSSPQDLVITTQEELEGFYIVKSILRDLVDPNRIQYKDVQSYCGINLDGRVSKTICRLRFDTTQKSLGLFDADGKEIRKPIDTLDALFQYANDLKTRLSSLL